LEARQGNIRVARIVFNYLMDQAPLYGPIYHEACRFEEKCEDYSRAFAIVSRGLAENCRYGTLTFNNDYHDVLLTCSHTHTLSLGPLWFSALRLHEKTAIPNATGSSIEELVERAVKYISKELIWKLYNEAAQMEDRATHIDAARRYYVKAVQHCPPNLVWKVWMAGARTELNYNHVEQARQLLQRALQEVPPKMRAMVLLECSRLEEYANRIDEARAILHQAKRTTRHEWKVFLESVLLEMRANNPIGAVREAHDALKIHSGTGRLWAVMIQLCGLDSTAGIEIDDSTKANVSSSSSQPSLPLLVGGKPQRLPKASAVGNEDDDDDDDDEDDDDDDIELQMRHSGSSGEDDDTSPREDSTTHDSSSGDGDSDGMSRQQQQQQQQQQRARSRVPVMDSHLRAAVEQAQRHPADGSHGGRQPKDDNERRRHSRQQLVFQRALREVPKSGEVWCEGARIALARRDFATARKYLDFAIQFTPQYGDSFIEFLRLELLEHGAHANISAVDQACVNADPNYGALWLHCKRHPLDSTRQVLRVARYLLLRELHPKHARAMYQNDIALCSTCGQQDLPPDPDGYTFLELSVNTIYQDIHSRSNDERRKAIFL